MSDLEPDHKTCRGCLSSDRELRSVAAGRYYSLLTDQQKLEATKLPCIALCWECTAKLRRSHMFQAQVRQAHNTLENCLGLVTVKPTLSSLSVHHKLEYDVVIEEIEPNEHLLIELMPEVKVERIVIPTKYKTKFSKYEIENTRNIEDVNVTTDNKTEYRGDDSDDDDNFDGSEIPMLPEITIKNVTTDNKAEYNTDNNDDYDNFDDSDIPRLPQITIKKINLQNYENKVDLPKLIPIIKTPALVKLEWELQKYIKGTQRANIVSNNHEKQLKTNSKPAVESDPDFSFDEDAGPKEKMAGDLKRRYKLMTQRMRRFNDIADVLSCFTKIEMNESDLKSTLEKEDAIVDKKRRWKCSICGRHYRSNVPLKRHALIRHKESHPDHFIKGVFSNPPPSLPRDRGLWRCRVCSRMFRAEHRLEHVSQNHQKKYFCNACDWSEMGFWTKEDHEEHWITIHRRFTCDICGVKRKNKSAMEFHIEQKHIKGLSLPCPECGLVFTTRKQLRAHARDEHAAPEPAEQRYCVECDLTFNSVERLQQHFYFKHRPRPKWPCGECGRELSDKVRYENHYKLHHIGKTDHCCHICGKYLSSNQCLKRHFRMHNNIIRVKQPWNKPCTVCGRKFQSTTSLRHHMYTHTGERPYKCEHCDAAYTQPYCLHVHLKKGHDIVQKVCVVK